MEKYSLTQAFIGSHWLESGTIVHSDGSISKGFEMEPLSSGMLEESFEGVISDAFFSKLSDLLSKLPNLFEGQILVHRKALSSSDVPGFKTTLYCFERVQNKNHYSHLLALFSELKLDLSPISKSAWEALLTGILGKEKSPERTPDMTLEKSLVRFGGQTIRALSLTELPQLTWKGCFQPLFEKPCEFVMSIRVSIPDRVKIKRQLETKRRISHALSITSSVEVRNIESNSVLHSSEETLERILVGKETLFDVSIAILLTGSAELTLVVARDLERVTSGIGNAGLFLEGIGTGPVLQSHIPGNKALSIRTLPILSENLSHILPVFHDYSRSNNASRLPLRSRSGEVAYLNLFSQENLNFNAFICGASGSGKSFLMNAILHSFVSDSLKSRLCMFDIGGSYRKLIDSHGGRTVTLSEKESTALIASFLKTHPVNSSRFYRTLVEGLCGSGPHITHSHAVAIDDLLKSVEGEPLVIESLIESAAQRKERFYHDVSHWLKPHLSLDAITSRTDLIDLIQARIASFDFKELESSPVLQKTTILLLAELLWKDLAQGSYDQTIIGFDEVWKFFAQSKSYLEEFYRTLRKYKAGIVSITQNLADYGDEAFAKMVFTNSFTKIFLQNGASAEYLKNTFDLPQSDIERALSVSSKKPYYSEFFALTPTMSQVFQLHPTPEFYSLANTENIAVTNKKETA